MRTSDELYHQVRWDPRFDPARFVLGVSRRGAEPKRIPLPAFVPGGDIPWHRVLFFEADGEVVWDRASGVDRIDATDAGRVRDPRLLRAPFFSARTPHAWDRAAKAWRPVEAGAAPSSSGASGAFGASSATRVRVLTWNTLWDRFDSDRIDTARRRPLLVAQLEAADADVIALQEVQDELLDLLLSTAWVRDGYTVAADPRRNDVDESGLLVLSRLPMREAGHHVLGRYKGVSAVVVETGTSPLIVVATHLTSDHAEEAVTRRATQLTRIAEGLAGVDGELLLVGDFNDGGDLPQTVLGFRDAWLTHHGADDATPTFDPHTNPLAAVNSLTGRASRLDRILLRTRGFQTSRAVLVGDVPTPDGLYASDHFGVLAELDLVSEGESPAVESVLDVAPTSRTALAWIPPAAMWPAVDGIRRDHDPQIDRWPPHVNVLFGFVPESDFDQAAAVVADAVRELHAFDVRLAGIHTFGHRDDATVWLDPAADGPEPWTALHDALVRRFPQCRGRSDGYTPHLTLGRTRNPQRVAAECETRLKEMTRSSARVGELVLMSRRGDEPMRPRALVEVGTGVVRWIEPTSAPEDFADDDTVSRDPLMLDVESEQIVRSVTETLAEGDVHLVGSRRMGCALLGADVDLVAVLPGTVDMADLQTRLTTAVPGVSSMREVIGARVPGLSFRTRGRSADLTVVATGAMPPARAVARRTELDDSTAIALSAISDAEAVLAAVEAEQPAFARLAGQVKAWAKARGLDSAPFGGVPGLAWCVLAAKTVATASDLSERGLLRAFFGTWAACDWREPVGLAAADMPMPAAPMTILTPSAPVRTCTAQVGPGMRDLIVQELYRVWELLEAGLESDANPWPELTAPPSMHRRHAAWAAVTVEGASTGRARGRMRALITALEAAGAQDVHAWPRPFEVSETSMTFAIGLGRTPPDAAALASIARRWTANLPGVAVAPAESGAVPTLR